MSHVILVAFEVYGDSVEDAQKRLMRQVLPYRPPTQWAEDIECWWIAEDERHDGSDNESAVFVPKGQQVSWSRAIARLKGMCPGCWVRSECSCPASPLH